MNVILLPEYSLIDFCELLATVKNGQMKSHQGYYTEYKTDGTFWYSRNCLGRLPEGQECELIREIKAASASGGPVLISYTQEAQPANLSEILEAEGYVQMTSMTGMLYDLENDQQLEYDEHIIRISPSRIEEWAAVVSTAFGKPDEVEIFKAAVENEECSFYAYLENDKIVGTAMLYTKLINAGIHEIGVLPEYRGRGICKKLVRHMLKDVKSLGISLATLQASAMGEMIYAGMGFEPISTIPTWMPRPEAGERHV